MHGWLYNYNYVIFMYAIALATPAMQESPLAWLYTITTTYTAICVIFMCATIILLLTLA